MICGQESLRSFFYDINPGREAEQKDEEENFFLKGRDFFKRILRQEGAILIATQSARKINSFLSLMVMCCPPEDWNDSFWMYFAKPREEEDHRLWAGEISEEKMDSLLSYEGEISKPKIRAKGRGKELPLKVSRPKNRQLGVSSLVRRINFLCIVSTDVWYRDPETKQPLSKTPDEETTLSSIQKYLIDGPKKGRNLLILESGVCLWFPFPERVNLNYRGPLSLIFTFQDMLTLRALTEEEGKALLRNPEIGAPGGIPISRLIERRVITAINGAPVETLRDDWRVFLDLTAKGAPPALLIEIGKVEIGKGNFFKGENPLIEDSGLEVLDLAGESFFPPWEEYRRWRFYDAKEHPTFFKP